MACGPLWETDIHGLQTRYTYDGAKRLIRVERDAAVPVENWNDADMTAVCPDTVMEMVYDGAGRACSVTVSMGSKSTTVLTEYDLLGRIISRTNEEGRTSCYDYSQDGLTDTETMPASATFVIRRLASGLVVEESGSGLEARHYSYHFSFNRVSKEVRRLSDQGEWVKDIHQDGAGNVLSVYYLYSQNVACLVKAQEYFSVMHGDVIYSL